MDKILIIIAVLFPAISFSQVKVDWDKLSGVTYSYIQNYDQNFWYGTPTFSQEILDLDGKEIEIKGYVIPGDVNGDSYFLSAFPFSECFFCGGAGQESVMELRIKNGKQKFNVDDLITFTGTLRLNAKELELNYILEGAKIKK
ncbi:MAG: DUF3299 domain-containing protein [Bacteroidia bacterium]|nr:DUF3299 domain-containing protein [Bacteroidia bacterium]